jgi:hypothetical protein
MSNLKKFGRFDIVYPKLDHLLNLIKTNQYINFIKLSIGLWTCGAKVINVTNGTNIKTKSFATTFIKSASIKEPWVSSTDCFTYIFRTLSSPKPNTLACGLPISYNLKKLKDTARIIDYVLHDSYDTVYDSSCWRHWAYDGQIHKFLTNIADKNVVLVGPSHLKILSSKIRFKSFTHLKIDPVSAMIYAEEYLKQILNSHKKDTIYLLQGGGFAIWLSLKLIELNDAFIFAAF